MVAVILLLALFAGPSLSYADTQLAMSKVKKVVLSEPAPAAPAPVAVVSEPAPAATPPAVVADTSSVTVDGPPVVVTSQNIQNLTEEEPCIVPNPHGYAIGVGDILTVNVVRPEQLLMEVTVSPDGTISFPYIGTVTVKGKTLDDIQNEMTKKLGEGYMKYPVVSVTLKESRSKRFFVYGEVTHPGPYAVEENMTVLRAISMAGGFTKFGSSSRVKVLRPRAAGKGYEPMKINIKDVMDGNPDSDTIIKPGDIVVVSEGVF